MLNTNCSCLFKRDSVLFLNLKVCSWVSIRCCVNQIFGTQPTTFYGDHLRTSPSLTSRSPQQYYWAPQTKFVHKLFTKLLGLRGITFQVWWVFRKDIKAWLANGMIRSQVSWEQLRSTAKAFVGDDGRVLDHQHEKLMLPDLHRCLIVIFCWERCMACLAPGARQKLICNRSLQHTFPAHS